MYAMNNNNKIISVSNPNYFNLLPDDLLREILLSMIAICPSNTPEDFRRIIKNIKVFNGVCRRFHGLVDNPTTQRLVSTALARIVETPSSVTNGQSKGTLLLINAVRRKLMRAAEILLLNGVSANVNEQMIPPLVIAVQNGSVEMAELLLRYNGGRDQRAIIEAIKTALGSNSNELYANLLTLLRKYQLDVNEDAIFASSEE